MVWGAIAGAVIGGVSSAINSGRARSRQNSMQRRIEREHRRLAGLQQSAALGAKHRYLGALSDVTKGYEEGIAGVEAQRRAGRVAAVGAGSVQRANTTQSMISRHLYNTGAYDARASADAMGLSVALDQIDAQSESIKAQLGIAKGEATADIQMAIGQLELQSFGALADLASSKLNYLQNFEYTANNDWTRFLGLIGGLIDDGLKGDDDDDTTDDGEGLDTGAFSGSGQRFDDLYNLAWGE